MFSLGQCEAGKKLRPDGKDTGHGLGRAHVKLGRPRADGKVSH